MKIKGVKQEVVEVTVMPGVVLESMRKQWLRNIGHEDQVIENGVWTSYEAYSVGHEVERHHGDANENDQKTYLAFRQLLHDPSVPNL